MRPQLDQEPQNPWSAASWSRVEVSWRITLRQPFLEDPATAKLTGATAANTTPNPILELPTLARSIAQKSTPTPPKSSTRGLSPRTASALPLTGAAAMAELKRRNKVQSNGVQDSRQTSPNPAVQAMHSLMGAGGMSRPTDAPAADKLSEPMRRAAEKITVPTASANQNGSEQVSPVSLGSFGTAESTATGSAMTATANDHNQQFVAEPAQMADGASYPENNGHLAVQEQDGNKAFSYPGPPSDQQDGGPSRGMSLPGYGQGSPKSPASTSKRHKCPYCSTDFTRHHNLKSHLLTHSQEKPYVCQTCQARFRRLHDLKRHTKLHTGERPHKCDKCGRQFARGDALARHNKGPGGCAGRRSSFGGEDDYGDGEGMEGVEYEGDDQDDGQSARRISEPNRKRQQLETPQDPNREVYRQHSSTYPPAPTRNMQGQGSMGPPQVIHPGSSSTATSPHEMSGHSPAPGSYYGPGQVFAEPGMMTSSPKPLSPGGQPHHDQHRLSVEGSGMIGRNRSTSLTTQFQQAHFGRGSIPSGTRSPPPPTTQFGGGANQQTQQQHNIQLPPLSASSQTPAQQPQRTTVMQPAMTTGPLLPNMHLPSQLGGQGQSAVSYPGNPQNQAQASQPGSHSSHGRSSGSSIRDMMAGGAGGGMGEGDLWAYVRQLEGRFSRMQDEYELRISNLREEVATLRGQVQGGVGGGGSYSSEMGGGRGY
ncbi:unnamed protein product [Zymoseptoria tritici ST99CH_3D7]|uniref:C2H2-type domain-containing protein n=1 Tax=Zymoseptoria tritici (strain ST99CH_3D7) TaxID=1276538 RepID=A0A1X7RYU1_ZYMT9|nr:unnamed protein product [Zymoseptoria tritici ST99CH_3D7]